MTLFFSGYASFKNIFFLTELGLTQNISQTLRPSCSSLLRGSLFRDLCVSPVSFKLVQMSVSYLFPVPCSLFPSFVSNPALKGLGLSLNIFKVK